MVIAEPFEITPRMRLVMARGDRILSDCNIEREGGTDVVRRPGLGELYRFGVLIGLKKEAEDAIGAVRLGKPFVVFERGRMKAL
jgi:hypothetical protein